MTNWKITGGRVLTPGGFEEIDISIVEGSLSLDDHRGGSELACEGCLVLPGIVDVHGDGFERVIRPRAGVDFPLPLALQEADRQMIGNGITTAYHGLTASWETGLRSFDAARTFLDIMADVAPTLDCDTRVNLRWEVYCLDPLDELISWLDRSPDMVLSLNDHLTAYLDLPPDHRKIIRLAERMETPREDVVAQIAALHARIDELPEAIARVTKASTARGLTVFAHDETSPDQRRANRALGVSVSEFPMTWDTARETAAGDEHIVLGAPNVLRGGSQNNAIDAEPAISSGLCSVLSSDYYYPAPLLAAFALADRGVVPLETAWSLVSSSPAEAVGLSDRGRIAEGLRADVLIIDAETRRLKTVFAGGRRVLQRD